MVIGFTAGAALLIAGSQVKNFLGINIPRGTPFYEVIHQMFVQAGDINPWVLSHRHPHPGHRHALQALYSQISLHDRRHDRRQPGRLCAQHPGRLGYHPHQDRGRPALPSATPVASRISPSTPCITSSFLRWWSPCWHWSKRFPSAASIAIKSEQRIDGNQEFIGQGLSNIVGSFFSGYASSGSFNRSGVNYAAGAKTPLATVFAAIALVLIVLLVAPLAAYLPTAAMAGILFLVAWGLIDFHHISSIWRTSRAETLILWITLIGTLINLEKGIFVGILVSLILYLYRVSRPAIVPVVPAPEEGAYHFVDAKGHEECPQVRMLRINGSIFFGAVDHVQRRLQQIDEINPDQKTVLITGSGINFVDVAGAEMLAQEAKRRRRLGGGLYFYRLKDSVYQFLHKGDYLKDIGEGGFFPAQSNVTRAIYFTLDPKVCRSCKHRIFPECHGPVLPDGEPRAV